MEAADVLRLYDALAAEGVPVRIDGGWCVDALLGGQTRDHPDLDIAVDRAHAGRLRELFARWGYEVRTDRDTTDWSFVLTDGRGASADPVDVHVYAYDEHGVIVYGVEYPWGSLTGTGVLAGREVSCVAPEWMFAFKTAYPPREKDRADVRALAAAYGFTVPESHR
ncbi:nucleotidyltransferase domain-containing protein [Streptomyces yaizuensis]|uniref:Aminoglycoside nucleotidyltransferase n=1 Tax=Streptomyces yaizuensis TaxID=2989713 RepID=A0ABQ5PB12_9ACTN|nr:aminoglycoside nucleotidyltransferase [Streptomyces sp. YSPA8]GLF99742.1 aminoglycoside nucleotidyltransferase [Streptomyces sp. YSPA8]